jgi:rhodanese-related sulfurtransferase
MEVLASTPMSDHDFIANGLYGQELARRLTRESEAGRFFLLDVRRREDFERCHIQGAVRVDFHRWAEPGNLALLPRDRKIVVLSYAGLAAAQVASGLRLLGYDAVVVKTGMNGWKRNDGTGKVLEDIGAAAYPVERKPPEPFAPAPEMEFRQPSGEEFRIIAERAAQVFRRAPRDGSFRHNTIEAGYLHRQLQNGGGDRYFILDLRREEDFEGVGHIGGASQVDFTAAMVEENFSRLPRDRRIVVVCYTGNLAAQLVTVLRLLGFDAVALRYGMIGWTMTPTTRLYLKDIESADYPVVSRAEDN